MDHLAAMAAFVHVVDRGSFSAAAAELALSKSAVSKQVRRLEDRLGVRLLHRTTRELSVTEEGAAFYKGCQRMIAEAEVAEAAVTHLAAAPRGRLKVSAPMSFGLRHLSPLLPDFLAGYPELSVDVVLNDRVVDLVEEGFDLAIRIVRLEDSSLIARRLAPCRHLLCAAADYLDRRGLPAQPEDLRRHDCLVYSYLIGGPSWRFRGPGGVRRVTVGGPLRVNNGDLLLDAAEAGAGVVMLPSFIAAESVRAGRLVRLLPEWEPVVDSEVHAVYPAHQHVAPKARVFIDFLAERFGRACPYWDEGIAYPVVERT